MSKVYSLQRIQKVPVDIETAWNFFSKPDNLAAITPAEMGFKIKNVAIGSKAYAGQVIEYFVKPLFGIPVYWMTEITHVIDKLYFVDEQRFGPYRFWHHQHHFKIIANGVEMKDVVHYKIPYWFIGDLVNSLLVKKELKKIFDYRYQKIEEKFGKYVEG